MFIFFIVSPVQSEINEISMVLSGTVSGTYSSSLITYYMTTDKLYLLSPKEVLNYMGKYDTTHFNTRQLDYYGENGVSTSNYSGAIKKKESSASNWWLRTAYSYSTDYVMYISSNGSWSYDKVTSSFGVSPAFRIG